MSLHPLMLLVSVITHIHFPPALSQRWVLACNSLLSFSGNFLILLTPTEVQKIHKIGRTATTPHPVPPDANFCVD